MHNKKIKIGETSYGLIKANAVDQKRLMLLVGARISYNLNEAIENTNSIVDIDVPFLVGNMLTLSDEIFSEVAEIVLRDCGLSSGEKVTIDTFNERGIMEYFQLVAEGVAYNLADFILWLTSRVDDGEGQKTKTAENASD